MRALTEGRGSTLYVLKWKQWTMPSGRQICALRASVRRTSDPGSSSSPLTGWPTPCTQDGPGAVALTGWKTPTCNDAKNSDYSYSQGDHGRPCLKLPGEAKLAGWAMPAAQEAGGTPEQFLARKEKAKANGSRLGISLTSLSLQARLAGFGPMPTGSSAETEKPGQLDPGHSRWLMGLPVEWLFAAPRDRPKKSTGTTGVAPSKHSGTRSSRR